MCVYGVVDQGDEGRVTRLTRHRAGYTACADGERRPTTPPSRRKEEEKKPKAHERQKKSENPPTTPRVALLWPSLGGYPSMFFAAGQANTTQRAVCAFHSSKRREFPFLPFLFLFFLRLSQCAQGERNGIQILGLTSSSNLQHGPVANGKAAARPAVVKHPITLVNCWSDISEHVQPSYFVESMRSDTLFDCKY